MKLLNLPFWDAFVNFTGFSDIGMYWLSVLLLLLCLALIGLIIGAIYQSIYDSIDEKNPIIKTLKGTLIDKVYIGSQRSTGTGTTLIPNSNGGLGVGIISTTSYSSEQFLFFVEVDRVYKVSVDMQDFYKNEEGDKVDIDIFIGKLSNKIFHIQLA